uniref:Zinc finger CCCH-type containing 7Ba n=1 Tax=Astyanax mexicanus TaxID=7994 RepID=A0A8B9KBK8_ASTMX
MQLVCNLLDEGNAAFREGEWMLARGHFSEGVSVAGYARAEGVQVPVALLESLYVNRAAALHNMGEWELGVRDCDAALGVSAGSGRALYRKAVCLKELGRMKDAYECSTLCLLSSPQVNTLRYTSVNNTSMSKSVALIECSVSVGMPESASPVLPAPVPVSDACESPLSVSISERLEDCELMGDELDSLLDSCTPSKGSVVPTHVPIVDVMGLGALPVPSPHLPPAFFPSAVNQLNSLDSFPEPRRDSAPPVRLLDALDSFSPVAISSQLPAAQGPPLVVGGEGLDSLSEFSLPEEDCACVFLQNGQVASTLSQLSKNPLDRTHDFDQACSACFLFTGPGVLDREFKPDLAHSCKKDILLCRRKGENPWRRVRPRPTRNNFLGAYVLCKGELPTQSLVQVPHFIQNLQEPIRSYHLDRLPHVLIMRWEEHPLSDTGPFIQDYSENNVRCLVHVVKSSSICYSKVRPLSPLCQFDVCRHELRYGCQRENSCSFAHSFIELECWILQKDHGTTHEEIVQESKKHWHKQRPGNAVQSQTNGTVAKGEMVGKGAEMNGKAGPVQMSGGASAGDVATVKDLRLVMKFVCSQCWKDGQMSEPDRLQKYCNAKARHSWTKERRVLLVKSLDREKWVTVRPLPFAKTYPQQYDICVHVLKQKKCHYIGNCSFAHSPEERELWTYMKNTGLRELQQVYDVWLMTDNQNKRPNDTPLSPQSPPAAEEKQICMPTDFAELMVLMAGLPTGISQHDNAHPHTARVFPGMQLKIIENSLSTLIDRLQSGCGEGLSCDFAHSEEELQEWRERRDFLRRRLDKARADMLIAPSDQDFGKYNFLLQD